MKLYSTITSATLLLSGCNVNAFTITSNSRPPLASLQLNHHPGMGAGTVEATGFIDTELRGAAMRLHTKSQAPKEGQIEDKPPPMEPYVTTHLDYMKFLVDSQHVYKAFEEVLQGDELQPELAPFLRTGLERSGPLETDIEFIAKEYNVERPEVGERGLTYAQEIRDIAAKGKDGIPEFMCHYYNHYFAHTAGGRMIGKKMSSLLLDKKTLEFYKWDGDINQIKADVKSSIEEMAAKWSREEKDMCVDATMAAFKGGGMINRYLGGM